MILGSSSASKCLVGHVLGDTAIMLDIRHLQISYNTPCLPPKILHHLCFSFLLGITAIPREIKNEVHCGRFASVDQAQFSSSHTFSLTCSRSLLVSPCPPECYFQSETKIEPDLRLGEWLEHSKMPPNHFAGLVCACLMANVNHSSVFV